jgi:hypothetical protein
MMEVRSRKKKKGNKKKSHTYPHNDGPKKGKEIKKK